MSWHWDHVELNGGSLGQETEKFASNVPDKNLPDQNLPTVDTPPHNWQIYKKFFLMLFYMFYAVLNHGRSGRLEGWVGRCLVMLKPLSPRGVWTKWGGVQEKSWKSVSPRGLSGVFLANKGKNSLIFLNFSCTSAQKFFSGLFFWFFPHYFFKIYFQIFPPKFLPKKFKYISLSQ